MHVSMSVYTFAQLCTRYTLACDKDKVHIAAHLSPLGFSQLRCHFPALNFFKELRRYNAWVPRGDFQWCQKGQMNCFSKSIMATAHTKLDSASFISKKSVLAFPTFCFYWLLFSSQRRMKLLLCVSRNSQFKLEIIHF